MLEVLEVPEVQLKDSGALEQGLDRNPTSFRSR